jgi:hypothetical protein
MEEAPRAIAIAARPNQDYCELGQGSLEAATRSPGPGVVNWLMGLSTPSLFPPLSIEVTL